MSVQTYFEWVVRRRGLVVLLSLVMILGAGFFLPQLQMDTRSDAFIDPNEPALLYRERVQELFGLADPIVVAVVNEEPGGIFNPDTLKLVDWLTTRVQAHPNVDPERVVSLATESNIEGTFDGMAVEEFFDTPPTSSKRIDWMRNAIDNFPLYQGNLVARDHTTTLIVAELVDEFVADETYEDFLTAIDSAPLGEHDRVHVAGEGAIAGYLSTYIDNDAKVLNPTAAVIITIVLIFAFFTLRGAVLPNLVVVATVVTTFGLMAAFGVSFFVITNALTVSLIGMAVADSIHVFSQYYEECRRDGEASQGEIVVRAMTKMFRPITLTTVTTMAGFFALYPTNSMPPIQYFGIFGGLGVGLAWLFAISLLPAGLSYLSRKPSRAFSSANAGGLASKWLLNIGRWVFDHPKTLLTSFAGLALLGVIGATLVTIEEVRIENFQTDERIYRADQAINKAMDGVYHLDVVVEADDYEGLHQPVALRRIEALQSYAEGIAGVGGSISVVDYIKQMNRAVNENQAAYHRIPDDPLLVSQLFLLYSASADPTDFEEEVDSQYQEALVRIKLKTSSYLENADIVYAIEDYLEKNFGADGLRATLTGRVNVDHHWIKEIGESHLNSVLVSFGAVFVMVLLLFRSVPIALITVIPVGMAILLMYAVMGVSNIWLGVGTTMFASIAIGLCVDFAIHTMDRLRELAQSGNGSITERLLTYYATTGRALFFNLLAIGLGFGVLMTSDVPPLNKFGTLVALSVTTAFVAAIVCLPLLFRLWHQRSRMRITALKSAAAGGSAMMLMFAAILLPTDAMAQSDLSGVEIMERVNARDDGLHVTRNLRIELTDRRGRTRVQETRGFRKYYGHEKRTVLFYTSPANVRDTGFLTYDYPEANRDDDQWLYLPALRKVRRISASNRGDYFLGTDFTYEEIKKESKIALEDYVLSYQGIEVVDGIECLVVEGVPIDEVTAKELGYSKVIWRVDSNIWMSRLNDFWDVNGNHLKTSHFEVIENVDDIWTAIRISVENHKTSHKSMFTFSEIDYTSPVADRLFAQRSLTRAGK